MCAIRGSLTIITSIHNEARFSMESKNGDTVQWGELSILVLLRLRGRFRSRLLRHSLNFPDLKVWQLR